MPCDQVYASPYSTPDPKRLCNVVWSELYFWLAHEQVPEIWVILLTRSGLPARYGLGRICPLMSCFWKYGMATTRWVPCCPTYPTVRTLLAGNWNSIVRFHCWTSAGRTLGSHRRMF